MRAGFAKVDITPRVGVEMLGFGAYLNRHAIGIRDRLWARAMAVEADGTRVVIVSLDLCGIAGPLVARIRALIAAETGVAAAHIMVHGTHTHSAPAAFPTVGWGDQDAPYLELLPHRAARACIAAVRNLQEAVMAHAEVPCEGIGLNREYDVDAPPLADVLKDDWRPAKPELTDTTCHVLRVSAADGRLLGFVSHFSCHPVVCCQLTRYIHGDYPGVATGMLERENPGTIGLFLQGAHGDVNSCCVHKPEVESLLALDVIASRFANSVRRGLAAARPLATRPVRALGRQAVFSRKALDLPSLKRRLAAAEALFAQPAATDEDSKLRMSVVYAVNLRRLIAALERGDSLPVSSELQGFRLGALVVLGTPFEVFQAIRNDVRAARLAPITWVLSQTNDAQGYALDRTAAARGGYAADDAPMIMGAPPFAAIHDELVAALLALQQDLVADTIEKG